MNATASFTSGEEAFRREDYVEALEHFKQAAQDDPNDELAHAELGRTLARLADFNKAIEELKAVTERWPNLAKGRDYLGKVYLQVGRYAEAEHQFRLLAALEPTEPEVLKNLGRALEQQRKYLEARREYELGIRYARERASGEGAEHLPQLYNNMSFVLAELGLLEDAEHSARQARAINPADWYANAMLARISIELADQGGTEREYYERALGLLGRAIENAPTSAPDALGRLWLQTGYAHAKLGQKRLARKAFQAATQLGGPAAIISSRNLTSLSIRTAPSLSGSRWVQSGIGALGIAGLVASPTLLLTDYLSGSEAVTLVGISMVTIFAATLLPELSRFKIGIAEIEVSTRIEPATDLKK